MSFRDLRDFIDKLDKEGELIRIKEELDPKFEISAVLKEVSNRDGPAVLIENVKGKKIPVAGNLLASRKRLAIAMNVSEENLLEKYLNVKTTPIPPKIVDNSHLYSHVIDNEVNIPELLPVLTYHEKDISPYITQGVVFMKDPKTGRQTMGVHRLQVQGKDQLGIFLASRTSTEYYKNAEELDKPLEVAIVIGLEPSIILASTVWLPFGDKISFAGSLKGEPVELVKARKVYLEVPAHAMIVLEGKILPKVRQMEGPFGESTGYYITSNNPVIKIDLVAHQENPVYAVFEPWSKDDEGPVSMSLGAEILKNVREIFPSVKDLRLLALGSTIIFSIKQRNHKEARSILSWILSVNPYIKKAIIVDDDVDIYNLEEVEWALSSRFQAKRDIIIMNDFPGSPIDPSVGENNITSKLGMDATKPLDQKVQFEKIKIPQKSVKKAKLILKKYI